MLHFNSTVLMQYVSLKLEINAWEQFKSYQLANNSPNYNELRSYIPLIFLTSLMSY